MDEKASKSEDLLYLLYQILMSNDDTHTSFSMQNESTMIKVQWISAIKNAKLRP